MEDSLYSLLNRLGKVGIEKYKYDNGNNRSSINVRDSRDNIIESMKVSVYKYFDTEYDVSICYTSKIFESLLFLKGRSSSHKTFNDNIRAFCTNILNRVKLML